MLKTLRALVRSNAIVGRLMEWALMMPLPYKLFQKLAMIYLQSESEKKAFKRTLARIILKTKIKRELESVSLSKSAVLKAPSINEKGVILVGFEHELERLVLHANFPEIVKQYRILFMPTWQPFYSDSLIQAIKRLPEKLYILPSSKGCYYKSLGLQEFFKVLPFHASSWVDENLYAPQDKEIDILMVANFAIYKRHKLLFEALRDMPKSLRVVLIGRALGSRTKEDILREADSYGATNRFELIESPDNEFVVNCMCKAKLVLGLSGREGSYVSLAESLFAGAAVAVYSNSVIGTKDYVNAETGFLIQPDLPLASQLDFYIKKSHLLNPRLWAVNNISASLNIERLNQYLRDESLGEGEQWTRDVDSFHIRNFEVLPGTEWSESVQAANSELDKKGIHFS